MTWQNNTKGQADNEIRSAWWVDVNINISSASSVKSLLDLIYWYSCVCFCLYMHIVSFNVLFNFVGAKGLFWPENIHITCWCETLQILCLVLFEMTNAASSENICWSPYALILYIWERSSDLIIMTITEKNTNWS